MSLYYMVTMKCQQNLVIKKHRFPIRAEHSSFAPEERYVYRRAIGLVLHSRGVQWISGNSRHTPYTVTVGQIWKLDLRGADCLICEVITGEKTHITIELQLLCAKIMPRLDTESEITKLTTHLLPRADKIGIHSNWGFPCLLYTYRPPGAKKLERATHCAPLERVD